MPAPLKISLTKEEEITLRELSYAKVVPQRVKQRATALRLNALGLSVAQIAEHLDWAPQTVREAIHRWQEGGLYGLWEAQGRGRKARWSQEDWQALEEWVNEPRRYSAQQLSQKLAEERQVELGKEQVRRLLKKKDYSWKRMRYCPPEPKNTKYVQAKQADWEMLKLWSQIGIICLKYLDESGSYSQSPTNYSYSKRGQQKRIRQKRRKGRRINILGVFQPKKQFDYALMMGTIKTPTFIKLMNWQADIAQQHFQQTGQMTVIVLDNASVHRSELSKQHYQQWQQKGLMLFFLPPYSPQMNRIEDEWLHLKRDELAGRVFEDELDLAYALMAGIENRASQGGYSVSRFSFN
jgi:transposase